MTSQFTQDAREDGALLPSLLGTASLDLVA